MGQVNKQELDKIEKFVDNFLKEMDEKYKDNPAAQEKLKHIKRVVLLVNEICPNDDLARVAAKAHDIGRFPQLEILGGFNDGKVLHHYLGEDFVTRAIYQGKLSPTRELDLIRGVIKYHGREKFLPFKEEIPETAKEIIDIVGRVDGIENGCIGAIGYLEREARDDVKGYKADNPEMDMKEVSPEVFEFFKKGQKFDKMKYCKTYADYTLFAAVLAIEALRGQDRNIAKAAMNMSSHGYKNTLEGYNAIFDSLVGDIYKEDCKKILAGFYNDKDYDFDANKIKGKDDNEEQEL